MLKGREWKGEEEGGRGKHLNVITASMLNICPSQFVKSAKAIPSN